VTTPFSILQHNPLLPTVYEEIASRLPLSMLPYKHLCQQVATYIAPSTFALMTSLAEPQGVPSFTDTMDEGEMMGLIQQDN
jgi:hypothetical protein